MTADTEPQNGLSYAMMGALGSMPIRLQQAGAHWYLPQFAPSGQTLMALKRRGLATVEGNAWVRTPLGESVWERR